MPGCASTAPETATLENLGGWLTTVVSRVCLDMLRSWKSRRERPIDAQVTERSTAHGEGADPEAEAGRSDVPALHLAEQVVGRADGERHDGERRVLAGARCEAGGVIGAKKSCRWQAWSAVARCGWG